MEPKLGVQLAQPLAHNESSILTFRVRRHGQNVENPVAYVEPSLSLSSFSSACPSIATWTVDLSFARPRS